MGKTFFPPPEVLATLPPPNYINPETRGTAAVTTAIVCATLSTLFVALRLIARMKTKKGLGWDDFWIVFGWVFSVLYFGFTVPVIELYGWKYHIWDIPEQLRGPAAMSDMIGIVIFILATSGTRISLLFFYLHLVKDAGTPLYKYAVYGFVATTIAASLTFGLSSILRCTPVSAFWVDPMPAGAHCIDNRIITMVGGCMIVGADFSTMLLPLPVVLGFNMPLRKRISVAVLLSLGVIVVFVSGTRSYYLWKSLNTYDITWESHPLIICSSIEILLTLVCACLPAIKALYEQVYTWLGIHNSGFRSFLSHGNTSHRSRKSRKDYAPESMQCDSNNMSAYAYRAGEITTIEELEEEEEDFATERQRNAYSESDCIEDRDSATVVISKSMQVEISKV